MVAMLVTIDKAGRVVIPKELRDRLELNANSELEASVKDGALLLSPARTPGRQIIEADGLPVISAIEGLTLTDSDVQRWRDDVRR